MKSVVIIIIIAIFSCYSNAQNSRLEMADNYFSSYEYANAATIYAELAKGSMKKSKNSEFDDVACRMAAKAYYNYRDYKNATYWYEQLYVRNLATKDDKIEYIKTLLSVNKISKATEVAEGLYNLYQVDKSIQNLYYQTKNYEDLKKDSLLYDIKFSSINSKENDFSPSYFNDGIVFTTQRKTHSVFNIKNEWDGSNYQEILVAPFVDKSNNISSKSLLFSKAFKSSLNDGPISFNDTYNMAFITRNNINKKTRKKLPTGYKEVNIKLYISTKNENGKWNDPFDFPYNSSEYSIGLASFDTKNQVLYFTSDMPGGYGGTDIWKSEFKSGEWTKPENLGSEINTPGDEMFPYIDSKGKLYFSSDGHIGMGGLDIFCYYLFNNQFVLENVGYPFNSPQDDFGVALDSSTLNGFFSSNRFRKNASDDNIYSIKINEPEFELNGTVLINDQDKTPLKDAEVTITNLTTGDKIKYTSDLDGKFKLRLNKRTKYLIEASKKHYLTLNTDSVSTISKTISQNFNSVILMEPIHLKLSAITVDKQNKYVLKNSTLIITDINTNNKIAVSSNDSGYFEVKLNPESSYEFTFSKEGYKSLTVNYNSEPITQSKTVNKKYELEKIPEVGDKFVLGNIYFDYGKYDLRNEGKLELDKLYQYLIDNPTIKIELSAHTDSRSSYGFNLTLSSNRAKACKDYLVSRGIDKTRIIYKGYSWSRLANRCKPGVECSEEEHQQNRRTEITILKK